MAQARKHDKGCIISLREKPRTIRLKAVLVIQIAAVKDRKKRDAVKITGIEIDGFGEPPSA